MREFRSPAPLPEFVIEASAPGSAAGPLDISYAEGWSAQQWWPDTTWRWARGEVAAIGVRNTSARPIRAELRFLARSLLPRTLQVQAGNRPALRLELPAARKVIIVPGLVLPPGETRITFTTSGPATKSDDGVLEAVTFKMENPQVTVTSP